VRWLAAACCGFCWITAALVAGSTPASEKPVSPISSILTSPLLDLSRVARVNAVASRGGNHLNPSIAVSPAGTYWVVWQRHAQGSPDPRPGYEIVARNFSDRGGSPAARRLEALHARLSRNPTVTWVSPDRWAVVWESLTEERIWEIRLRLFGPNGAPEGPEARVSSDAATQAVRPSIARLADGRLVVVWESVGQDGSGRGVFGRVFEANGEPLGNEFLINDETRFDQQEPKVVPAPNGFLVVWTGFGAESRDRDDVFVRAFDPDGVPRGPEIPLAERPEGHQRGPDVARASVGGYVAVWESRGGIAARLLDSAARPTGPELAVDTGEVGEQSSPRVQGTGFGELLVLWDRPISKSDPARRLRGRLIEDATGRFLTRSFWLTPGSLVLSQWGRIAATAQGDLLLAWTGDLGIGVRRLARPNLDTPAHEGAWARCWDERLSRLARERAGRSEPGQGLAVLWPQSAHTVSLRRIPATTGGRPQRVETLRVVACPEGPTVENRARMRALSTVLVATGNTDRCALTLREEADAGTFRWTVSCLTDNGELQQHLKGWIELPLVGEDDDAEPRLVPSETLPPGTENIDLDPIDIRLDLDREPG
jgi:hypothetical protein